MSAAAAPVAGAGAVRVEDAFDVAAVDAWLRERAGGLGPGLPEVRQFSGGASNLTYLLRYPERDLILRRPPPGAKAASAHDMRREHDVQAALKPVFPYVPEMVALCRDHAVLGSDFYVMERVAGTILRKDVPAELGLDAAATRRLCESVVDRLVDLHAVDPQAAGLAGLGRGPGYVRRQVEGWSERYRAARTRNAPSCERVMRWLAERLPDDVGACVVHNDYRFDNVVLAPGDPQRIAGVLDWEMATVGDPLMDLGGALAYWVQADDDRFMHALRRQPTHAPGMLTRAEVVERYADRTGIAVGDWAFYEVFGLFRLAVIIQQIYRRYALRHTRNPAFRHYWLAVRYLDRRCRRLIRQAG
ncbi:MAG TPA: phosphotransferase family protein [Capillimicrobium sp.]|nr:phosphotransferase family protein [Capillimicrobium sp.]